MTFISAMQSLVIVILSFWVAVICLRIYYRRRLISFLLVGLSIPPLILSIPLHGFPETILLAISNLFFWAGAILMGTYEAEKLKEFGSVTTAKDWIIGNIPNLNVTTEVRFSRIEDMIFIAASFALIISAIINYWYLNGAIYETVGMFVMGLAFISYYIYARRKKQI